VIGSEVLCASCAIVFCPHGEPLHFHHDGCPACSDEKNHEGCLDCGLPYSQFPLDVVLPRAQWLAIHPDEHGVLCAGCIVKRAATVAGATVVHAVIEITPQRHCDTCIHLTPFELAADLNTCPIVNIRIHTDSAAIFGCNQHEPRRTVVGPLPPAPSARPQED
jgi:hypothetical protein